MSNYHMVTKYNAIVEKHFFIHHIAECLKVIAQYTCCFLVTLEAEKALIPLMLKSSRSHVMQK